ncbi:SRPBCC family protein [Clostridium sp. AN503]|uniref:SRPBCC family protein n=1 Tax=Clostridium sp. AN503 TaxID=3160598 RepID=UPI00345882C9
MAVSNIKVTFPCDIHTVWKVITDVAHSTWRSDVSRTEVLNERQFVEYTKEGYATTFTTTVLEPFRQWEFDMENSNMKGHWTGVFKEKDGWTEIEFTEDVTAKKGWMRPLVRGFLKKQQKRYVSDLRKALSDQ